MKYFGGLPPHLHSQKQAVSANKRSVIEIAGDVLGVGRVRFEHDKNLLKINGKWVPSSINDIMRAANRKLASEGKRQIINNPEWVVRYGE